MPDSIVSVPPECTCAWHMGMRHPDPDCPAKHPMVVDDVDYAPDAPLPTTDDVRSEYAEFGYVSNWEHQHGHSVAERKRRFDRWLATQTKAISERNYTDDH